MNKDLINNLKEFTILYADNKEEIRNENLEILKFLFKEVYIASNNYEILKLYKEVSPTLIITNIKVDNVSVIETLKKIRKDDFKTPIAMITTLADNKLILNAIELNLLKCIVYPLTKEKLEEVFSKFLERQSLNNIITLSHKFTFYKKSSLIKNQNNIFFLTNKELIFLDYLLNKKPIITYEEMEYLLDIDRFKNENAIRQFIKKLRKKLPSNYLRNIRNYGYFIPSDYL
ncbi:response regulator transcription factor [Malaciobacter mytili]|uniref:response regulator transcription factor n=1 Tax=Malaciobacter mytili TaxID=603050 RepID=UPI003A85A4AB